MTDNERKIFSSGYTFANENTYTTDKIDLAEIEKLMREFRQKFNDDISRALFSSPPNPLLRIDPPKIEYEPKERPFAANWRYGFGMPVYESRFIPRGEGAVVAGHGVIIGTGPVSDIIDKFGIDLGLNYSLPKWAIFAILAAALMLIVLLLG